MNSNVTMSYTRALALLTYQYMYKVKCIERQADDDPDWLRRTAEEGSLLHATLQAGQSCWPDLAPELAALFGERAAIVEHEVRATVDGVDWVGYLDLYAPETANEPAILVDIKRRLGDIPEGVAEQLSVYRQLLLASGEVKSDVRLYVYQPRNPPATRLTAVAPVDVSAYFAAGRLAATGDFRDAIASPSAFCRLCGFRAPCAERLVKRMCAQWGVGKGASHERVE